MQMRPNPARAAGRARPPDRERPFSAPKAPGAPFIWKRGRGPDRLRLALARAEGAGPAGRGPRDRARAGFGNAPAGGGGTEPAPAGVLPAGLLRANSFSSKRPTCAATRTCASCRRRHSRLRSPRPRPAAPQAGPGLPLRPPGSGSRRGSQRGAAGPAG